MGDYSSIVDSVSEDDLARTGGGPGHTPYDRAVIRITEEGKVGLFIRTYYGGDGTPAAEWHGRVQVFELSGNPDPDELRTMLAEGGKAAALIDRVIAGHSIDWDGNNVVGRLTEDANEASEALADMLGELEPRRDLAAWDAGEWLFSGNSRASTLADAGLTVDSTDEQIDAAADALVVQARTDGVLLELGAVAKELRDAIERVRWDAEDEEA